MQSEIEFYLAGFQDGRGYAIKDIKLSTIKWLSEEEVFKAARSIKIYGVDTNKIDLNWFRSYLSRYIMSYGIECAQNELGVTLCGDKIVLVCNTINRNISFNFIELIEDLKYADSYGNCIDLKSMPAYMYEYYFADSGSSFFHLDKKYKTLGNFSSFNISKLNVQSMLEDDAVIYFNDGTFSTVIEDLQMHRCKYHIRFSGSLILNNIPDDTKLVIDVVTANSPCDFYISHEFNLDCLEIATLGSNPRFHIDNCVNIDKLYDRVWYYIIDNKDTFISKIEKWHR